MYTGVCLLSGFGRVGLDQREEFQFIMSSGFISESVIEKKKKQRQLEWEQVGTLPQCLIYNRFRIRGTSLQVRKPEDPKEAPEEPVDTRSLYERLQANKTKAQEEWDEAHKLKNQVSIFK
jgi:hypothetical protein